MTKTVMERLQEHYDEAKTLIPEDRIVGVFLQGSQNYGLEIPGSDVDSKCIVLPTLEDIIFNRKAVSTTHIRANDEHIDLKDIRLMFQTFRKQNMNFIEILFTEYKIINPLYVDFWNELIEQNELIAQFNPHRAVSTMKGVASEKYHALEHRYPSRVEVIDKFGGYDPKQLHHLLRIHDFISRYTEGVPYSECLHPEEPMAQSLKAIKQYGADDGLEAARELAKSYFDDICAIADEFRKTHPDEGNAAAEELLDNVQRKIMKKSITIELMPDVYNEILKTLWTTMDDFVQLADGTLLDKEKKEGDCEDIFKNTIVRKGLEKHD